LLAATLYQEKDTALEYRINGEIKCVQAISYNSTIYIQCHL
jgi:hypothetical protein